jgi:hypothetical protein
VPFIDHCASESANDSANDSGTNDFAGISAIILANCFTNRCALTEPYPRATWRART